MFLRKLLAIRLFRYEDLMHNNLASWLNRIDEIVDSGRERDGGLALVRQSISLFGWHSESSEFSGLVTEFLRVHGLDPLLAFKGNSLDRYLMDCQFTMLLVVFVIKRCTSPCAWLSDTVKLNFHPHRRGNYFNAYDDDNHLFIHLLTMTSKFPPKKVWGGRMLRVTFFMVVQTLPCLS